MNEIWLEPMTTDIRVSDLHAVAACWENPEHRTYFIGATISFLSKQDETDTGEIYWIVANTDEGPRYVGVTGYLELTNAATAMRWHAILPPYRGRGYSKEALSRLIDIVASYGKTAIYETTDDPATVQHFQSAGFQDITDSIDLKLKQYLDLSCGKFKHTVVFNILQN